MHVELVFIVKSKRIISTLAKIPTLYKLKIAKLC